jgi:hypothetical protein
MWEGDTKITRQGKQITKFVSDARVLEDRDKAVTGRMEIMKK